MATLYKMGWMLLGPIVGLDFAGVVRQVGSRDYIRIFNFYMRIRAAQHTIDTEKGAPHGTNILEACSSFVCTRTSQQRYSVNDIMLTLLQVGADVSNLAVGDLVYGTAPGSLAEFVVVDAGRIAAKPASLSVRARPGRLSAPTVLHSKSV
jgi:hypothetical protein